MNIRNRALGGKSSRTFIAEGFWDGLCAQLIPGDLVLIQFGHNDYGPVVDESKVPAIQRRARGSLPGVGENSQQVGAPGTIEGELVHSFGWYLRKMIADTIAKEARPVILSMTVRNSWRNGRVERGLPSYVMWSREVARKSHVPFVDVTNVIAAEYEQLGPERVSLLYPGDQTHFNAEGADLHARVIVRELARVPGFKIGSLLSTKGSAVLSKRARGGN